MTQSALALRQFVADNNLARKDGIIIFDAFVMLYKGNNPESFFSEIEIITLPDEMVMYILGLSTPGNQEKDMYRTKLHRFSILSGGGLEIQDDEAGCRVVISLKNTTAGNQ